MNHERSRAPILASLAGLALVGLILVLLQWAAPVVTPIMLAMYLAALAAPLYLWMSKRGWATGWSLAALVSIIALLFGALGLLLLLSVNGHIIQGLDNVPRPPMEYIVQSSSVFSIGVGGVTDV